MFSMLQLCPCLLHTENSTAVIHVQCDDINASCCVSTELCIQDISLSLSLSLSHCFIHKDLVKRKTKAVQSTRGKQLAEARQNQQTIRQFVQFCDAFSESTEICRRGSKRTWQYLPDRHYPIVHEYSRHERLAVQLGGSALCQPYTLLISTTNLHRSA